MFKISIVPDTNAFMARLDIIKKLYEDEFPVDILMSIPRIVLKKLDSNKNRFPEAREAIKFIQESYNIPITEFEEGQLKEEDKMDIVRDSCMTQDTQSNDDKILSFASKQTCPVILTSDKAFYLKSKCHSMESIFVQTQEYEDVKLSILKIQEKMESMDIDETNDFRSDEKIKEHARNRLFPVVLSVMERNIGKMYAVFFPDNLESMNLDFLLELIKKHSSLFQSYLPKRSWSIIQNLTTEIKKSNGKKLEDSCSKLLVLFRIV